MEQINLSMYIFNPILEIMLVMKTRSIRRNLFFTYSLIILIAFFAITILFASIEIPNRREQVFTSLQQNSQNITTSLDSELNQAHTLALNIAHSTMIRDSLIRFTSPGDVPRARLTEARTLETLLTTLIAPSRPAEQIFFYTQQDEYIAAGNINGIFPGNARSQPWYEPLQNSPNNRLLMYIGFDEELARYSTNVYGQHFVSLSLNVFDSANYFIGHLEIRKSLARILTAAISYQPIFYEQIYIFDSLGNLIYPLDGTPPDGLFDSAATHNFPQEIVAFSTENYSGFFVCAPSTRSGFVTIAYISNQALLAPIYLYLRGLIPLTFIALLFTLTVAYLAAKRLTRPILTICQEVSAFDLTNLECQKEHSINITELNILYQSFYKMRGNLAESVNKQLALQHQEMQSRMIALEAQMNSHFLYNSLAVIQSMADEGLTDEVVGMCQSMSSLLRYISSDKEQQVPLHKEIQCTKDYLSCMKGRYQEDLTYSIDIPPQMNPILVPKLCTQLLVENAIKFSSQELPPYHVSIVGTLEEDFYTLTISDNGPGFEESILEDLYAKFAKIDETNLLPTLAVNGMGLLNVYIRLKLLYDKNFIFRLENKEPHGARVTIGVKYGEQKI